MRRFPFICLVLLLLPGAAQAQCYTPSFYGSSYYAPTYYPPKVITQFVPFVLPIFSAAYVPGVPLTGVGSTGAAVATPPAKPAVNSNSQTDAVILEALKRLDARLGAIEQRIGTAPGNTPPTMPPAPPEPGAGGDGSVLKATQTLVLNKCAKCHSEGGQGNLVLIRARQLVDPATLQPQQKVQILIRTYTQDPKLQMPPPGKGDAIQDQEYALLAAWIAGRK